MKSSGLNWIYKAFAPTDLAQAIAGVRGLGIRGCAVSMPYKEDVIALVDVHGPVGDRDRFGQHDRQRRRHLTAYNTDYTAIEQLLERNAVPAAIRGRAGRRRHGESDRRGAPRCRLHRRHRDRPQRGGRPGARRAVRVRLARRRPDPVPAHGRHAHQRDAHRHGRRCGGRRAVLPERPSPPHPSCSTSSRCRRRRR